jgi:hypothetical protein
MHAYSIVNFARVSSTRIRYATIVAEPHHIDAAPAPGSQIDAAPSPTPFLDLHCEKIFFF